ncbi:redoxin family protein [Vibrio crassostreae]|uniref:redoxin family protein n=1 Tax=Vibrio crassostreae TaxID=246167 RepID=UPI001FED77FD|nr:redoxin family protein [Vibrio crassostreae]
MKYKLSSMFKTSLVAVFCLFTFSLHVLADDVDYSADGERRAKSAGESLIGQPAPVMSITTLDGNVIDLAKVYGKKPVYIKFWATWCIPCRQQMPGFEEISQQYGEDIQIISINTGINDDLASVTKFLKKMGLTMPTTIDDGKLARAFHLRVTPQHLLIDRDGKFAYFGHVDDEKFHQALTNVIAQPAHESHVNNPSPSFDDTAYKVGDKLTDLSFTTIDNESLNFKFGNDNGKKVGVVFFGPWCEWYLEETSPKTSQACTKVRELLEEKSQASSIDWVTVSTNVWSSKSELHNYKKSYGTTLPIVFDADGELFKSFGVNQIPTITLIDADGTINVKSSIQDSDFDKAIDAVSNLK